MNQVPSAKARHRVKLYYQHKAKLRQMTKDEAAHPVVLAAAAYVHDKGYSAHMDDPAYMALASAVEDWEDWLISHE